LNLHEELVLCQPKNFTQVQCANAVFHNMHHKRQNCAFAGALFVEGGRRTFLARIP